MVKIRLIPIIYIKNGFIVRSENFSEFKIIGNVVNEVKRYNHWDIDELVCIDISREKYFDSKRDDHKIQRVSSLYEILELISKECFMPLSFGGGIRDLDTIKYFLKNGADKIIVNTLLFKDPSIIQKALKIFGSQAIVASLDYKLKNNEIVFYIENGQEEIKMGFSEVLKHIESLGCGEILLTSIDRDGSGEGYDINSITKTIQASNLPLIACGGAIDTYDFEEAAKIKNISGIAAGNMFHFTENIYPRSKKYLKGQNLNFR